MNKSLFLPFAILFTALITITSCTSPSKPTTQETGQSTKSDISNIGRSNLQYEVLNEEKSETIGKAQLIEYAIYKDTIYTKDALRNIVVEIYNLNKNKNVFEKHDSPTVVAVYLFTSEDAMKDKAEWIAMLVKGPNEPEPRVSFNDFKITALNNIIDNVKSENEIELEKLNSY